MILLIDIVREKELITYVIVIGIVVTLDTKSDRVSRAVDIGSDRVGKAELELVNVAGVGLLGEESVTVEHLIPESARAGSSVRSVVQCGARHG